MSKKIKVPGGTSAPDITERSPSNPPLIDGFCDRICLHNFLQFMFQLRYFREVLSAFCDVVVIRFRYA